MTTIAPSAALVATEPVCSNFERLALAGFLAGYGGLTREAYALDLRQFATWCGTHSLHLFQVRRADIESFARDLEVRGRARLPSHGVCAPSAGSTGTRSRKNCWITLRRPCALAPAGL